MKVLMPTFLVVALLALSLPAFGADGRVDYATVIDVSPVVRTVHVSSPREECWVDDVVEYSDVYQRRNSATPTIVGGVVGGAIGHAVGHRKRNKQVGAAVGAVVGAVIGNAIANEQGRSGSRSGERCEVIHDHYEEERIVAYDVRYRYNNHTYTTRTSEDPGDTIQVRVTVSPVI
jgi:uncharacterized protein YcfJ